ncbi:MAG TPA: hypothetical protein VGQ42_04540 [Candidatus Dormibacteraeota bacterium]|jgi:hypothetical protein|nr:hypothetical protein [Candidatus Dormibacteraeota bacterium]
MGYTPTRDVILGIVAVMLGSVAFTASVHAARRTRNWLFFVCALGALAFTVGVVGQRVFPTEDALARDRVGAAHATPGVWEAGVQIPVIGVSTTPLAIGGFLVAVVGLSLVLFFEAVPAERAPVEAAAPGEEADTV